MIDLSALGLVAAQPSHQNGKQQNGGHGHQHADDATSFGDLVGAIGKKAGQKGSSHHGKDETADDGKSHVDDKSALNRKLPTIDLRPTTVDASEKSTTNAEAAKDGATETTAPRGRISISDDLQQLLKAKPEEAAADKADSVADDLAQHAAANAEKNNPKLPAQSKDPASRTAEAKPHSDPAQELRAMLEPAHDAAGEKDAEPDTDVKAARKDKSDDATDDAGDTKAQVPNDAAAAALKADAVVVAQATPHAATQHASSTDVDDADTQQPDTASPRIEAASPNDKTRVTDIEHDKDSAADKSTNGDKTDFVSVLESRRYLGFSNDAPAAVANTNSHALTNAIKADPSLAQMLQDVKMGGSQQTATEVNTLKLQMSPEHLGNMTASLRLKGDELSVEVRVETVDAYRQLSHDQDGIVKALKEHGFSIDQVSIQLAPSARADSGQTGGNQSQSGGGQQSMQDGSQGGMARQRDDDARRNANQNNWTGNERTASFSDTGNGTDDTRSGNLYL